MTEKVIVADFYVHHGSLDEACKCPKKCMFTIF